MSVEIQYHLRALTFAVFCTLCAVWTRRAPDDRIISDCAFYVAMYWLAGLSLLWWRVPNSRFALLIDQIKRLAGSRPEAVNDDAD